MKRVSAVVFGVVMAVALMGSFAFAQQDKKGCTDPPLFSRVPGFLDKKLLFCCAGLMSIHGTDFASPHRGE